MICQDRLGTNIDIKPLGVSLGLDDLGSANARGIGQMELCFPSIAWRELFVAAVQSIRPLSAAGLQVRKKLHFSYVCPTLSWQNDRLYITIAQQGCFSQANCDLSAPKPGLPEGEEQGKLSR